MRHPFADSWDAAAILNVSGTIWQPNPGKSAEATEGGQGPKYPLVVEELDAKPQDVEPETAVPRRVHITEAGLLKSGGGAVPQKKNM